MVRVREVTCKTALSPCGLPGFKYSLNPYRGCEHGCLYCYSPSVIRERREWGSFVDVKINIPTVLAKELGRKAKGVVWFGSVCDAYQPVEMRYQTTQMCLDQLAKVDWPVSLLTKSALVQRDYDLMASFTDFELGFSIAYADESSRQCLEPGASTIDERLGAISKAVEKGLQPWAFIAPISPGFTDRPGEIGNLLRMLAGAGIRRVGFDQFRPRPAIWPRMKPLLEKKPSIAEAIRRSAHDPQYYAQIARIIGSECEKNGITLVG